MIDLEAIRQRHRSLKTATLHMQPCVTRTSLEQFVEVCANDIGTLLAEVDRQRGSAEFFIRVPKDSLMEPGRWFRINSPDGSLWMETSDEEEARAEAARTGWTLERLFESKPATEWRPA